MPNKQQLTPQEIAQEILELTAQAKTYSRPFDAVELFALSEQINYWLAYFVKYLMEAESAYRQKVQKYVSEGLSVAGAEAKAKAEEEYLIWRKLDLTYKRGDEQIKLIKKFASLLGEEFKRI